MVKVWPTLIELPEILFALLSDASLTPCLSEIPPNVSPERTLYLVGLPLLEEVLEFEDEPFDPGIVSVCPTLIVEPDILLAFLMDAILTPCF